MFITLLLPIWAIGPFHKLDAANPVLWPQKRLPFECPMRKTLVDWEENDVFNPAALLGDHGEVVLLYRAEDRLAAGLHTGQRTSRVGFARSRDGLEFERDAAPVLYPAEDNGKVWEWEGGCEDPRVVRSSDGVYWMTYTAWDRKTARLCVAFSRDLHHWTKCGPAFSGTDRDKWSKSGSIVSSYASGSPVAAKIGGRYWMYFGEGTIHVAYSEDLRRWTVVKDAAGDWQPIVEPRPGKFDSSLVEPGPPAMLTSKGIVLIYNARNSDDPSLPVGTYAPSQALFDAADPSRLVDRMDTYFMRPDRPYETQGQVNQVCFVEGMVRRNGKWMLYYGTADSKIAVAEADAH